MGKRIDLTGKRFGKWTVIEYVSSSKPGMKNGWICECECGNISTPLVSVNLRNGRTTRCMECKRKECKTNLRHGMRNSVEYTIWSSMLARCKSSNPAHKNYYDRGIIVCDEWKGKNGFMSFYKSVGPRPNSSLTIERRDNDGNYCPLNVYWATRTEQSRNRRMNVVFELNGQKKTVTEWAIDSDIDPKLVFSRLYQSWTIEDALTRKKRDPVKYIVLNGEKKSLTEWAKIKKISKTTLLYRISNGWSTEAALNTPGHKNKILIEFNGKKKSIREWAKETGISRITLFRRYKKNWQIKNMLTIPVCANLQRTNK